MRQITVAAMAAFAMLAASAGLAGCASESSRSSSVSATPAGGRGRGGGAAPHTPPPPTAPPKRRAPPPWFVNNKPTNGQGYESAVAYAVAAQLGFKPSQVTWAYEPFDNSYAPGPKKFDFDINEVSYSAQRAQVVTFSDSYYDVQQALVALKNSPIATKHTPAELKSYVYGDQVGTTSLA